MTIAIYARKSIERENSISCDTQIEYCKAVIRPEDRGKEIITYVDNGYSGGNVNRDGFQKMMREIEKGNIEEVIVYRLDRISRSLADFVDILNTLKKYDVKFISSQESFDTSSPYGEMIVKILMVFAEFERQSIIARVTQAYEHRSELGFYMGGRKPYGFELEECVINNIKTKKLKPISEEIEQIKYIFECYAAPNVSLGRLLKNLTENNIKPLSGGGWTTAKLSNILKNPIYVAADSKVYEYFQKFETQIISPPEAFDGVHGIQIYGKTKHNPTSLDWSDIKAVVMTHEGVVSPDIWIKCQQKILKNKQVGNAISNKTSWLGGKIICGKCGRTMTTIKGKLGNGEIQRYFNCTGKSHFKDCKGTKATIYADSLEDMIYDEISLKLTSLKNVKRKDKKTANPELNALKNNLKSIELKQDKIADTLIGEDCGADLVEILNRRAEKLKAERTMILLKIDELECIETDTKSVVNLSKKWEKASFEEKRAVCNVLINHIVIDENGNSEIIWNV